MFNLLAWMNDDSVQAMVLSVIEFLFKFLVTTFCVQYLKNKMDKACETSLNTVKLDYLK